MFKPAPLTRWALKIAVIFLMIMTMLRVVFFIHFHTAEYTFANCIAPFLLGLRFDIRTTCIIAAPVLLFGSLYVTRKSNGRLTTASISLIVFVLLLTAVAMLFLKNNKAGLPVMISLAAIILILLTWLIKAGTLNPFKNKTAKIVWKTYLLIFSILIVFFYVLDFQHFDYLRQRLNASVLNYTQDAKISFNMVWQTYPVFKIIFAIILSVILFFTMINTTYKNSARNKYFPHPFTAPISFLIGVLFIVGIFGTFSQYPLRWSDAFSFGDDFKANLALNPVQSFFSSLQYRKAAYDPKQVKEAYPLMAAYLNVPAPDSTNLNFLRTVNFQTNKSKPNIVIVICESFSAYKSSMYGNPLNTTPYFNQLSKQGVFFDRCFTPAYGTARGVWAVITGTPDVESPNTASRNPAIVDQHTIINDMTDYEKFYFLGGSTSWANIRGLLTNNINGLHLYEEGSYKAKAIDVWGISDKHLFLESNDVVKQEKKPFIAVIQTSDNHRPYTIPMEDKAEFKMETHPTDSLKKYGFNSNEELNAFRYTDFCYAKFMEAAKKESYFSNTIFVFVGDHGIRGEAGNMFPKCWTDFGVTTQHVPLLFYAPSILKPQRIHNTCSQVDILPTVATIAQMPYYNLAMGTNILDTTLANSNVRFPHHAFLFDPDVSQIGMMTDKYCYVKNLISKKEEIASSVNNDAIPKDPQTLLDEVEIKKLTQGWYQTAKYILAHNKKKNR